MPFSLRSFKHKARKSKNKMRRYLGKLEKNPPKRLDLSTALLETEVWQETECLACANCCKTMTPTFNKKDVKRISAHLQMTPEAFTTKWLKREKGGEKDLVNKKQPCQFLNLVDNKCSIYEVRPEDCSGFPHLSKKMKDYIHVHKQNVEYCPATHKLVEKMMLRIPV